MKHRIPFAFVVRSVLAYVLSATLILQPASAHRAYIMNDNHTDYGWNDTVAHYETSMLSELDYYLARVASTSGDPPAEQTHFNADCWYYLYLYQHNRSAAQFQNLIDAMLSGHITVPLNPFVTLYGALPTEAAIRAGYFPGRMERQYGVPFLLAQDIENATNPWGLVSLWAGSRAKYTWKGICGCVTQAPYANHTDEVFRWQGPDNKTLLMKWYQLNGSASWGGYAEARDNLSPTAIQSSIDHFATRSPLLPITGLFGGGWDDVTYETSSFETLAHQWNIAHPGGDQVIVSNGIDYFQDLESYAGQLNTLRGGWGNDWDLWPEALAARTAQTRRAIEALRTSETLGAIVQQYDPSFWPPRQAALEASLVDYFKYFEHTWGSAGAVPLSSVVNNKKAWAQHIEDTVAQTDGDAATRFATLVTTPSDEDRLVVFNPLSFTRTDYADLPIVGAGPYVVTDVTTNAPVPSQTISKGGNTYLRILATGVPSLGYRTYRYVSGSPAVLPDAGVITGNQIESDLYRVTAGPCGKLTGAFDKAAAREMAGTGLNDFGGCTAGTVSAENVGPVSATLRIDISGTPNRRVRVTLLKDIDRIEIEDEIVQSTTATSLYRYNVNLTNPQIRFEEVGGIARPGLAAQGGDYLPGTRADFMTLNHFVNFGAAGYNITLSNWDASAMRVGNSTTTTFDLPTSEVSVLALGNPSGADITDQGGDAYFLNRFALHGSAAPFSGAEAMQASLAHQNPLRAVALARGQQGPLTTAVASLLAVSAPNVLVTALKPSEDANRGWIVRLWELDGVPTNFTIDASAFAPATAAEVSLIETDIAVATLSNGIVSASIGANEIKAYRFEGVAPSSTLCTTTVPGQTVWSMQRLLARFLNDGLGTNDRLYLNGVFAMATGSFSVDPLANGAQVEVRSATGVPRFSAALPAGAYAGSGPGWIKSRTGKRYTFRDRRPGGTSGITKLTLFDKGAGKVQVSVWVRKTTIALLSSDVPLAATVVLGGAASSAAGECGVVTFASGACSTSATGTRISCR